MTNFEVCIEKSVTLLEFLIKACYKLRMILNSATTLRLSDLKPHQTAIVVKLHETLPEELHHRLKELGLIQGAKVELIRRAPWFKSPVSIRVLEGEYALRIEHAEQVEVQVLVQTQDPESFSS